MGPGLAIVFEKEKGNCNFEAIEEKSSPENVNKNAQAILRLIKSNPYITTSEISKIINITKRGVLKNIHKLKEQNIIKRIGPNKGGYWEVVEN